MTAPHRAFAQAKADAERDARATALSLAVQARKEIMDEGKSIEGFALRWTAFILDGSLPPVKARDE